MSGLVALPGFDQSHLAGAIVTWSLSGATNINAFTDLLNRAGIPQHMHPVQRSPEVALKRALSSVAGPHLLLRRVAAGQWALVHEDVAGGVDNPLNYRVELQARLLGQPIITPSDHPLADAIRTEFYALMEGVMTSQDLGAWLIDRAYELCGVACKQAGGLYFVPAGCVPLWQKISGAVTSVGPHTMVEIPAVKTEGVTDLVLRSMQAEADQLIASLDADLSAGESGHRALRAKQARAESAIKKVGVYEALLGKAVDGLQDRMNDMRSKLMAAALEAEALVEQQAADAAARKAS